MRKIVVVAAALALVLWLGALTAPVLQNGDAAVYNDQVDQRNLAVRTSHIGYMALGIVFRALLPGPTDLVMNRMTVVIGVAGLAAIYFTARRLTQSDLSSAIAALGLLCIPAYTRGLLISEVDVPLAAFVAIAYCFAVHGRPWIAGPVFGYAMLISPLAALTLPAFVLAPLIVVGGERTMFRGWLRAVSIFAISSLLVYGSVVALNWQEYLYGGRGLLHAPRSKFSLPLHVQRSARFFWAQAGLWLLVLYLVGAGVAIFRRSWPLVLGAVAAGVTALVFGERAGDVPIQLPTLALVSPLLGFSSAVGIRYVRLGIATLSLAVVVLRGFDAYDAVRAEIDKLSRERAVYVEIKARDAQPPMVVGVRNFTQTRRLARILYGTSYSPYAMTTSQFRHRCQAFAREGVRNTFWFIGRPVRGICTELLEKYQLAQRIVHGRKFSVLVPR